MGTFYRTALIVLLSSLITAPAAFCADKPKLQITAPVTQVVNDTAAADAPAETDKKPAPAQTSEVESNKPIPFSPFDPEAMLDNYHQNLQPFLMSLPEGPQRAQLQSTMDQIDSALDGIDQKPAAQKDKTEEKIQVLADKAPMIAKTLTVYEPPPGIDPGTWQRTQNDVADVLNQLGPRNPGAYQSSLELSQRVLRDDPDNRDALSNIPVSYLGRGDYDRAIQTGNEALRRFENDEKLLTTLMLANYNSGRYAEAMENSKRALAVNPNNETAFRVAQLSKNRVTTAKDLGLDNQAQRQADKVAQEYAAMVAQRAQVEAAAKAEAVDPARFPAAGAADSLDRVAASLNRQAKNKIKLGDYQGAIQLTDRVIERSPKNSEAYYLRAAARNMTGQYQSAAADASEALRIDPDYPEALDARASAFIQMGKPRQALADADRSVGLDASSAFAFKNRAVAKEHIGDLAGMIDDYRQAARLNPAFSDELEALASKYGFALHTTAPPQARPARTEARTDEPGRSKKRFALVLVSSLTGGLLIAFGLLHILMGGRRRRASRALPGAGEDTQQAILGGSGLNAAYRVLGKIGNGGMGVVLKAEDKALGRKVAIKKMREEIQADERERARFLQEARIVAALHHQNIVDIHSILEDEGELYLIFEFVEGKTVDQVIAKKTTLTFTEAQFILRGVCNALEYAHKKGVIHRDLKPSNIMVTSEGMVKVMDFGIAKQAKDAMAKSTQTRTVAGTPQYMAPEQEEGIVRRESDVFSLGACLYEMVTGQGPFPAPATTASKINKRYTRPSRIKAELPAELDALIDACLEPDPEKRISSVGEFRQRLDSIKLGNVPSA